MEPFTFFNLDWYRHIVHAVLAASDYVGRVLLLLVTHEFSFPVVAGLLLRVDASARFMRRDLSRAITVAKL